MTTKIFEELPSRDNRPSPAGAGGQGPTNMKEKMEKKVRQAVYDIRYRARREGMDVKQAYSQYMQNSSLNGQERNMVKAKIFGTGMKEDYNTIGEGVSRKEKNKITYTMPKDGGWGAYDDKGRTAYIVNPFNSALNRAQANAEKRHEGEKKAKKDLAKKDLAKEDYNIEEFASNSVANALFKVFVEGVKEEFNLGEEYLQELENTSDRKYKVRVTDKNGTSYVRYATRDKISDLRANPNIESVEMTEYGEPYEGERSKGDRTAAAKAGRDYDGDGKVESGAKEHAGSVHNAIQRKSGGTPDGKDTSRVKEDFDFIEEDFIEEKKNSKKGGRYYNVMRGKNTELVKIFPEVGKSYNEEFFPESAVSTAQQKFMGMVHAYKKGEMKNASPEVKKAAKEMSDTEAKKFASTKHEGLPQHVKKKVQEETACDSSEPQKDTRGDYAKKEMIKNRLRSGLGVKNPIVMVSDDQDVKEDLQASVTGALKKGADFMKTNPVGKAASAVLAPVGTGRRTVTDAEQKQKIQRNVAKEEVEMIDERRREDKGTQRKPRDKAFELVAKSIGTARMGVKPRGQKKEPGKKPPAAGEYGSERRSPEQIVKNNRAIKKQGQENMSSRFD
jgi:hypothetical protein